MIHRRSRLAVVSAAAFIFIALASPVSGTAGVSFHLGTAARSLPQGRPLDYRLEVTNASGASVNTYAELSLSRVGSSGSPVTFSSTTVFVASHSSSVVTGTVTSSQWFARTGTFRLKASDTKGTTDSLTFEVTEAPVRVPRFDNVTARLGVAVDNPSQGPCGDWAAGAAWGDANGDGRLDLYLPRERGGGILWLQENGRFVDATAAAGVGNGTSIGIAATFVDYDNDGDPDLYVVNDGPNRLYRNNGDGTFTDVTTQANIDAGDAPHSSASWGDYDNDGNLDLYVPSYTRCEFERSDPIGTFPDTLYHNNGDGTFTDVTALLDQSKTMGFGFQASWFDYNGDGRQDLYLGDDYVTSKAKPNFLWRNDGPDGAGGWTFTDTSTTSGTGVNVNTMGIAIGDYDRDLDLDMALSNVRSALLLRNNGDGTFSERAQQAGVARPLITATNYSVTWGEDFVDLNDDGWLDLYVNGGPFDRVVPRPQPNAVFVNGHNGRFLDLSAPSGADDSSQSRGAAFADYDRDGRVDVYVVNQDGVPHLFHNVTPTRGFHWLEVDTVGTRSNRDGCGARLVATTGSGAKLLREVFCGSTSLAVGSDPTVHFGLGSAERVRTLTIDWPSGVHQVVRNLKVDRLIRITEPPA